MVDFAHKESYGMDDFIQIIALLRSPGGCPWDIEQTHGSLKRNLLEEAYEVCEAIDADDDAHLKEELGDLLMQVILHSRIGEETGRFGIDDVADAACKKLILRHPHVFAGLEVSGSDEVLLNWDEIKLKEKSLSTAAEDMEGVAKNLPALWRAEKIQKKAAKAGLDMSGIEDALDKIGEDLQELRDIVRAEGIKSSEAGEKLGELLFSGVYAARFADTDPEEVLHGACEGFISRFDSAEDEARAIGAELRDLRHDAGDMFKTRPGGKIN
ncbi:MAG: nucleoside triphosphate pyrophosphohydrolase [Oscillospiraceae bacterium]|nr:nucleoside triphosphate pyrophosphohydrolase [Oscillospiraceae bacterium]